VTPARAAVPRGEKAPADGSTERGYVERVDAIPTEPILDAECECAARSIETPDLRHWSACMRELSLHILDALQNSAEAGATLVQLSIEEDLAADLFVIAIQDNGRGMDEETLARVFDPFYTTRRTRHVGLGLPLFKAATERCRGDLILTSRVGVGTTLRATFQHSHLDRAPLGDITGTLMSSILGGSCDLSYEHRVDGRAFAFNTVEIKAELEGVSLLHPAVRSWLRAFIAEGEATLNSPSP
jgi:Histidine kinase-, DNA gyrase B-, and HSP90-like ATPase